MKTLKFGMAALALTAAVTTFAQETNPDVNIVENETEEEEGAIGWTPVAIGLLSPVQLPWGMARWDVFGLDLNILYSDAPKMYGLGIGGLAMRTRDGLRGVEISGLCNWDDKDVYGLRLTLGANIAFGDTYGWDSGCFAYRTGEMHGVDVEFIGSYQQENFWGVQIGGLVNFTTAQTYGANLAIGGNISKVAYGLELGGVFNFTDELHGCQIGLVNYARECPWGFQIGLVNIILDNQIKVLPIVNAYF